MALRHALDDRGEVERVASEGETARWSLATAERFWRREAM